MQHEIKNGGALLNASGNLQEPGWARSLIKDYHRSDIKAPAFRIKEWDYYIINNQEYGVALTIADNGYMSLLSVSVLDFLHAKEHTSSVMTAFPMGKLHMPESSKSGDAVFKNQKIDISFNKEDSIRKLNCHFRDFCDKKDLELHFSLYEPPMDSMVIATPFQKDKHFYYNQKINCMNATGHVTFNGETLMFSPDSSFATLDWGRGVWTYDNTWYWGNANGFVNGKPLGFNIGYGFGDTSAASENLILYDGVAHKLSKVTFNIPTEGYLAPWTFSSDDHRFEMDFLPVLDRKAHTNAFIIESDQHQVFGRFSGRLILDDGSVLEIKDFMGFAEKVRNRY